MAPQLIQGWRLFLLIGIIQCLVSWAYASSVDSTCRCFPGESCWPTREKWDHFNHTIGGKLIATVPIGSVCHDHGAFAASYDAQECARLKSAWDLPETHYKSASSVMAPFFANMSCDPFLPKHAHCVIGTYVQYTVNVSQASDIQNTIKFAKSNNIRLVIRNTGHDYLGKSTGAGAIGIWTHHLKDIEFIDYESPLYTGKAIKAGAGVQVFEVIEAAHAQNLVVVAANGQSVGFAGGYSQGGGHSQLASTFGLAADQVLQWEVITANGDLVVASPSQNSDLYWALAGGGGGTYGIVLSVTSKAYPELSTATANLTFTSAGVSKDIFMAAVQTMITSINPIVDAGGVSVWMVTNESFATTPTTVPGGTKDQLQRWLNPVLDVLRQNNISHTYFIEEFNTYYESFQKMSPVVGVTEAQIGGRLIPRSLVETEPRSLMSSIRSILDVQPGIVFSGISVNVSRKYPDNAVNPAWREAAFDAVIGTPWSNDDWDKNLANRHAITHTILPLLARLTPDSGAYLNEADPQQPHWQRVFYGENYARLLEIKLKYDPEHMFYALTGVGSEFWVENPDGRLCRALPQQHDIRE